MANILGDLNNSSLMQSAFGGSIVEMPPVIGGGSKTSPPSPIVPPIAHRPPDTRTPLEILGQFSSLKDALTRGLVSAGQTFHGIPFENLRIGQMLRRNYDPSARVGALASQAGVDNFVKHFQDQNIMDTRDLRELAMFLNTKAETAPVTSSSHLQRIANMLVSSNPNFAPKFFRFNVLPEPNPIEQMPPEPNPIGQMPPVVQL